MPGRSRHITRAPGTVQPTVNPDSALRIRIRPGVLSSLYAAHSRDVSQGAPQAPRVETRAANETDFTPDGVADLGTEIQMPQWHRGVTN